MKATLSLLLLLMGAATRPTEHCPTLPSLRSLHPGSVQSVPLRSLHPSQGKIGQAFVAKKANKALKAWEATPPAHRSRLLERQQARLNTLELPCTVMPDGLCWLADGHHRTSVALWTETLEDVEGTFRVPIRIIDNYSEMPLVDALTRLVQAHQLYLSPPALKHFNALLSSDMTPDLRELALTHFIEAEIPSQFTQLSDDPLRNAVGNVLHSLLKDIPTEAFIEFRVQEFLAQKLGINPGGSTGKFTQKCALDGLGQPCTQLTPKAMKRVAQIIYDHPSISEMLLQSIPIDQDCPIHSADSKRCRELFLERIKHESFYHY